MIIPAIDLIDGQVVRLKKGDFNEQTTFSYDPLERIQQAYEEGAKLMHIVDLDGAKDPHKRQLKLIGELVKKSPLPIQTGGGIRSEDDVKSLLELGVEHVVIGSTAVKNPSLVKTWLKTYGAERLTLAFDVKLVDGTPYAAVHGWQEISEVSVFALLEDFADAGIKHVLVTDIDKDGMMQGPNVALYKTLHEFAPDLDFIASGGMSTLDDVKAIARSGAGSVVLGRALLEGKFSVKEAVACWQSASSPA